MALGYAIGFFLGALLSRYAPAPKWVVYSLGAALGLNLIIKLMAP